MTAPVNPRSKRALLHALTFVVAFCSFGYEMAFSELLTVIYGGTVRQYSITVGLFFFSLGVGSLLARDLDDDRPANFFRIELLLALVAPLGLLFVLAINAYRPPDVALLRDAVALASRLPVVVVGVLSGFELPVLAAMVEAEADDERAFAAVPLTALRRRVRAGTYRALGAAFHVSADPSEHESYSTVLAMDYVGGLFGSVVYALVLYPRLGLIPTVFVLGLLNGVAALAFVARFSERGWGVLPGERRALLSRERAALVVGCLVVTSLYAGVAVRPAAVDDRVTEFYLENRIEAEYPPGTMAAEVTDQRTTTYQRVVTYERTWTGDGANPYFAGTSETCLRLDAAVQACESWVDGYHRGLVDVPMTMYPNGSATDVLLIGGGDWVAVDRLRRYGVSVDHVDVDAEFMRYARNASFLAAAHDDAYRYDRLDTAAADAYAYLGRTDRTYDLILLDLPGILDDDLLALYSTEFYRRLRGHLRDGGVVVTWTYSRYGSPRHHKAYVNTVRSAGFDRYLPYWAYDDLDGDGAVERVERFYVLSAGPTPEFRVADGSAYVDRYRERYRRLGWRPTPRYDGVEPNSVFHPNYDILVKRS